VDLTAIESELDELAQALTAVGLAAEVLDGGDADLQELLRTQAARAVRAQRRLTTLYRQARRFCPLAGGGNVR